MFFAGWWWRLFPNVDPGDVSPSVNDERRETRLSIAEHEYPRTLVWAASVLLLMTVLTYIGEFTHGLHTQYFKTHVNDVFVVLLLLGSAWALSSGRIPRTLRAWVLMLNALALVLSLLWQVTVEGTPLNFTYAMFVLIGYGVTSLATGPYLCGAAISVTAATIVAILGPVGHAFDWILVALTAAGIGAILLRIRLQSIVALADATTLAKELATVDQLTGVLNRRGLLEHVPDLWSTAQRYDESVFVAFIDIRGLKQANDQRGHDYGDGLILSAAQAAMGSLRGGDVLARWGGDEFVVVGIGALADAEEFARTLQASAQFDESKQADEVGTLSIGTAAGRPEHNSVTDLIGLADEDMYRRRTADGVNANQ